MELSIIVPVYNSESIVEETVSHILRFLDKEGLEGEVLLINDGSKDASWERIQGIAEQEERVVAIDLLQNYGQHTAVFCGIEMARGRYLVTLDDDLQNPPQEVRKLYNKAREGYDLVFGRFPQKQHASHRKFGTKVINYLNRKIFHKPDHIILSNFRIFTSEVANRVKGFKTYYPYIPGLLLLSAQRMANVETEHHPRKVGASNYNLWKIAKLVSRLLFNYSSYPLRLLTGFGFVISFLSFLWGVGVIIKDLYFGVEVEGWTTLVVLISFLGGFMIILLGVIGEYIARVMTQLSLSAPYQISRIVGQKHE